MPTHLAAKPQITAYRTRIPPSASIKACMLYQLEILPLEGKRWLKVLAKKPGWNSSQRMARPWVMATTLSAAQTTSLGPILSLPNSKIASQISSWCVKILVGTGTISYFSILSLLRSLIRCIYLLNFIKPTGF